MKTILFSSVITAALVFVGWNLFSEPTIEQPLNSQDENSTLSTDISKFLNSVKIDADEKFTLEANSSNSSGDFFVAFGEYGFNEAGGASEAEYLVLKRYQSGEIELIGRDQSVRSDYEKLNFESNLLVLKSYVDSRPLKIKDGILARLTAKKQAGEPLNDVELALIKQY